MLRIVLSSVEPGNNGLTDNIAWIPMPDRFRTLPSSKAVGLAVIKSLDIVNTDDMKNIGSQNEV